MYSIFLTFADPLHRKPVVTIEGELTTINAIYDQPLQLVCKASGYPEPKFIWRNRNTGAVYTGEVINYLHEKTLSAVNKATKYLGKLSKYLIYSKYLPTHCYLCVFRITLNIYIM